MKNFNDFLTRKLMPVASKMGSNKFLIAVRDGIMLSMPLIITGSLFIILATGFSFPSVEKFITDIGVGEYLWKGTDSSFGLMGLIASFGIANSLAKQYNVDGLGAGIISLSSFITVTPFINAEGIGTGIPTRFMSAQGLFVAILMGLINGYIYQIFINKKIEIKMPDSVPPAVSKSFSAIIPGAFLLSCWLIIFGILDKTGLPNLHEIAKTVLGKPLGLIGNNLFGVMFIAFLNSCFQFVGLHGGSTINKVVEPVWLANLNENVEAFKLGKPLEHIFTSPFVDNFVFIGGSGATFGLIIAFLYLSKKKNASKRSKMLAPMAFLPGLFSVNEPVVFGIPIVLNVILLIPYILAPMVNCVISYFAMASGIIPLVKAVPGWTTPPIISGFLATGSIKASILQLLLIVIDILLYFPFIKTIEKRYKMEEENQEKNKA